MFKWIRNPLTWMVVAEMVVVSLLIAAAWNVIGTAAKPALASPIVQWPGTSSEPTPPAAPDLSGRKSDQHGPLPGLNLDSSFWQQRLRELNRDQAYFERLEWRIVHAAMESLRRYLEAVVLPSIRHAERA
jgi:Spy/CpxP family protein refolding chaperone